MAQLQHETLSYSAGDADMQGHLAWDDSFEGPRPGVLVAHEWWGCNEYAHRRADMLAELGYVGLAMDLYGGGVTAANPDQAGELMNGLLGDLAKLRARFNAALSALRAQKLVDADRIAAIGYCMGGGVVVHMARAGADLRAVASFHGSLGLVRAPGPDRVSLRVAAYHGEDDVLVPPEDVAVFEEEMTACGAHWQLVQLPGCLHGFSNPQASVNGEKYGLPLAYSDQGDAASWAHMRLVLAKAFSV
jgi:dienelactone hydrolase